jgi:hypothetical protein
MARTLESYPNIRDYTLSLDDLGRPKVLDMDNIISGKMNSAISMISRLLLLKKGTYMDHPNLGIDIRGRYRFAYDDEIIKLNQEITEQISLFLPEFIPVTVVSKAEWKNNKKIILIYISINSSEYEISYDPESTTIEGITGL